MDLITVVDNGTTIVVTCPDDVITFTIATENARLMESTPARAWVQDDNGDWYIYPTMMFHLGTAVTGMAGNDEDPHTISGNWKWYALNAANETNASAITTALQDNELTINTGSAITDFNLPDSIGSSGFAADGAIHIEPSSGAVKLTFDRTRYNQPVIIHEAGFQTGTVSSPTEHLMGHLKLNERGGTGTQVFDEVTQTWMGIVNASVTFVDGKRGKAALFDETADAIEIEIADQTAMGWNFAKGSIAFTYRPSEDITAADGNTYLISARTYNPRLTLRLDYGDMTCFLYQDDGTGLCNIEFDCPDLFEGVDYYIMFSYDTSRGVYFLTINGNIIAERVATTKIAATGAVTNSDLYIGNYDVSEVLHAKGSIQNIKFYDACILPYGGGPFLTNDGSDYSNAHSDVSIFWDCESPSLNVFNSTDGSAVTLNGADVDSDGVDGGKGITVDGSGQTPTIACSQGNGIDFTNSEISFWYKATGTPSSWATLLSNDAAGYDFALMMATGTAFYLKINGNQSTATVPDMWDGKWHHFKLNWEIGTTIFNLWLDGILYTGAGASNYVVPTSSSTVLYIGNRGNGDLPMDGIMDRLTITNKTNTPDNWSAFGKPRLFPFMEVTD